MFLGKKILDTLRDALTIYLSIYLSILFNALLNAVARHGGAGGHRCSACSGHGNEFQDIRT
jgi:hypothetical protein